MYGLTGPSLAASPSAEDAVALQYSGRAGAGPSRPGRRLVLDRAVDEPTFSYTRAGVAHRVWYMDAQAIADRLQIARANGLGVGVWRLGEEDQSLWSSASL